MILTGVSGAGLWLFLKNSIVNHITFRTHFAFLDHQTAKWLVILQNLAMLMLFVLVGYVLSDITQKNKDKKYSLQNAGAIYKFRGQGYGAGLWLRKSIHDTFG